MGRSICSTQVSLDGNGAGGLSTPRTTLEREFGPDAVRRLKAGSEADLLVGGAELAGAALHGERRFGGGIVHLRYEVTG